MRLSATPRGVQFSVRAQPRASRDRIVGPHGEALKVAVSAPPEGGKANDALVRLLAKALGVSRSAVRLVGGRASRDKLIEVEGLTLEQLRERIANIVASGKGKAKG